MGIEKAGINLRKSAAKNDLSPSMEKSFEIYETAVWENGIKRHWLKLGSRKNIGCDLYESQQDKIPWFGDIVGWWNNLNSGKLEIVEKPEKKHQKDTILAYFPTAVRNNIRKVAVEMNFLLPEEDQHVRAFLPVLLAAYCENRRDSDPFIIDLFNGENSISFEQKKSWFLLSWWRNAYPGFNESKCKDRRGRCKRTIPKSVYSMYARILTFFFFLKHTSDICNVSWSFCMFDYMTGYLSLLSRNSRKIKDVLNKSYKVFPEGVLKRDPWKKCILDEIDVFLVEPDFCPVRTRDSDGVFRLWQAILYKFDIPVPEDYPVPAVVMGNCRSDDEPLLSPSALQEYDTSADIKKQLQEVADSCRKASGSKQTGYTQDIRRCVNERIRQLMDVELKKDPDDVDS